MHWRRWLESVRSAMPFPPPHRITEQCWTAQIFRQVICSTPDTHAWFIEEAAQAGKHIFCEKPIANDLPSIDRTLDVVERVGVKLQVGFNRRFDAKFTASINLGMSSKMRPGYLSNGKQVGEWTTYDKNGNV